MTVKTENSTVKAVVEAIEGNVKYVGKNPTANLAAFAKWVEDHNDVPLKTKGEKDAFATGVRLAGLRSRFQADRRAGKIGMDVTFADYAIASTGTKTANAAERTALLAGIGCYTKYVAYRNERNASATK